MSEILFPLFIVFPFILMGGAAFFRGQTNRKGFYGIGASVLWVLFCVGMIFCIQSHETLKMPVSLASFLGLSLNFEIDSLKISLVTLNSMVLLLNVLFAGRGHIFSFLFSGTINGAIMAESLYGFFVVAELAFLAYYIYICNSSVVQKKNLTLMRYSNLFASALLSIVILRLETGVRLNPEALFLFWGVILYFFIKLSIIPFYSWSLEHLDSGHVVDNILVPNSMLVLLIYGFKRHVVEIFPEALAQYSVPIALSCVLGFLFFHALSITTKSFVEKIFMIRAACASLMVGAPLVVGGGLYILLASHVFALISLYVLTCGSNKHNIKGWHLFLLAMSCYALMFFPMTGNFFGFYKIIQGYKEVNGYLLWVVFFGLALFLLDLINLLFLVQKNKEDDGAKKRAPAIVACICLLVIFLIGINPTIIMEIMGS